MRRITKLLSAGLCATLFGALVLIPQASLGQDFLLYMDPVTVGGVGETVTVSHFFDNNSNESIQGYAFGVCVANPAVAAYIDTEPGPNATAVINQVPAFQSSGVTAELLGKPESYVMISIQPETPLIFGGSDEPAAFVRLKSIGLPVDRCPELSKKICNLVEQEIGVPKDRVFIDFKDVARNLFGWNAKTF